MDRREHSIYFDDYNTWDMWHIIPSSRPTPTPPDMVTNTVTIPGRSGSLDLSEALTGYPVYNNRTIESEFILIDQERNWMDTYQDVMSKIHGKKMKIRLYDDPTYYYIGRVKVSGFTSNSDYSSISISCDVEPYKNGDKPILNDYAILKFSDFDVSADNKVLQMAIWLQDPSPEGWDPLPITEWHIGDTTENGSEMFHHDTPLVTAPSLSPFIPSIDIEPSDHLIHAYDSIYQYISYYNLHMSTSGLWYHVIPSGEYNIEEFSLFPHKLPGIYFRIHVVFNSTSWSTGVTNYDYITVKMTWPDRRL